MQFGKLSYQVVGALVPMLCMAQASDTIFDDGFEYNSLACPAVMVPPDGVPRTRKTSAGVSYGVYPATRLVQLFEYDSLWGYNSTTGPVTPFPGVGGASPVINGVRNTDYVAVHFRTPAAPNGLTIEFNHPSYIGFPVNYDRQYLTMVVSQQCGDFTLQFSPTQGCMREMVPASDAALVYAKFTPNAPTSWCNLYPDTDYYVNMMFSHPDVICKTQSGNPTPICLMGTVEYNNQ